MHYMLLLVFSHWNPVPSQEAMIVEKTSTLNIYMLAIYIRIITLVNANSHHLTLILITQQEFIILIFKQTHFGYKSF